MTYDECIEKYCQNCSNLVKGDFYGRPYKTCGTNVNYPEKCVLRKEADNENKLV